MENSIQPSDSLLSIGLPDLMFREERFISQMCCPISWQVVSPQLVQEVTGLFLHSHTMNSGTTHLWLLPGIRQPPMAATHVLYMSHPCPAALPQVPSRLYKESHCSSPSAPPAPRGLPWRDKGDLRGSVMGTWGGATGGSENLINCRRGDLEKEVKTGRLFLKDKGDRNCH